MTMREQCDPLSVIFFGMMGHFSAPPLRALLRAGVTVSAVVIPALTRSAPVAAIRLPERRARRSELPLAGRAAEPTDQTILEIAREAGIAVYEVGRLAASATLDLIRGYAPDALCVACFDRRIPAALLGMTRLGCLNVHPSLLPENRGADPLFWTFQRGDRETGVTIHLMDSGLDSGPVLAQRRIAVAEGVVEAVLERECATVGGELLVAALRGLASGSLTPEPQDESRATSYPVPQADDYVISGEKPARWAYNFAAGIAGREQPLRVVTGGATFRLIAPLAYDADAALGAPYLLDGDVLTLRCSPGVFTARVAMAE